MLLLIIFRTIIRNKSQILIDQKRKCFKNHPKPHDKLLFDLRYVCGQYRLTASLRVFNLARTVINHLVYLFGNEHELFFSHKLLHMVPQGRYYKTIEKT